MTMPTAEPIDHAAELAKGPNEALVDQVVRMTEEIARLRSLLAEQWARVAALEGRKMRRLNPNRCKWVSDGEGGRFVLPGCYGSIHRDDLECCNCRKFLSATPPTAASRPH